MKNILHLLLFSCLILSCKNNTTNSSTPVVMEKKILSDSAAIEETIHDFYKFYSTFENDTTQYNFVDDSGKYLKLDQEKLKKYLDKFFQTGLVSEEFINNEREFYEKCGKLWGDEEKGDVPSGMDADKMYCGQDGDFPEFTKAPVTSIIKGDRATAKMIFKPNSGNGASRNYELKKENGKWLMAKVECNMGIK